MRRRAGRAGAERHAGASDAELTAPSEMERNDPYLVLLRRELTRAQARLRRCERERDALRAALAALAAQPAKSPRKRSKPRSKKKNVSK